MVVILLNHFSIFFIASHHSSLWPHCDTFPSTYPQTQTIYKRTSKPHNVILNQTKPHNIQAQIILPKSSLGFPIPQNPKITELHSKSSKGRRWISYEKKRKRPEPLVPKVRVGASGGRGDDDNGWLTMVVLISGLGL